MVGLDEGADQDAGQFLITLSEERSCQTLMTDATSTTWRKSVRRAGEKRKGRLTNAVSVLLDTTLISVGQVVVDDVDDVADIDTAGRDTGGDHDGRLARAESTHGVLTLTLSTISMDGSAGHAGVEQEVVQLVGSTLVVDKDDGTRRRHRVEEVQNSSSLHMRIDLHHTLMNVQVSAAGAANTEADVLGGQVLSSKLAQVLGEGSREEQVLNVALLLLCCPY